MSKTARRTASDPRRLTQPGHYLRYRIFSEQPLDEHSFFSFADLAIAALILLACIVTAVVLWFRPLSINYGANVTLQSKTETIRPVPHDELPTFTIDPIEEVKDGDPEFFEGNDHSHAVPESADTAE